MTTPNLIFIVGPQAVGKMTVGRALSERTDYKFMHNHQTIDLLLPLFDFGSPSFERLVFSFRMSIFEEVAASQVPGFIFSCVTDFDRALDRAHIECYAAPFLRRAKRGSGGRVLFVELEASLKTRLSRNASELRLQYKTSKRDVNFSEQLLRDGEAHRHNSHGDFPYVFPHLKINNETLSPLEVAAQICGHFKLNEVL